ncbi:MAG: GTP-binding protein [Candidatus Lokiarchaeota archaeon]|nr:GTP-binding protein [Candidatus Lokiarchaeota archaeon]
MFDDGPQPAYVFKICLLGQVAVGKTCIARRLCYDTFDANTKLTIGIDFYTYELPIILDGEETFVRLSIWDLGGQVQFRKLFHYYIRGADGVFMVFDLSNLQTLLNLDWWYEKLSGYDEVGAPRIIIGAKNDLAEKDEEKSRINDLIINQFLKTHEENEYYKTSSKTGFNIDKIFVELSRSILDKYKMMYELVV